MVHCNSNKLAPMFYRPYQIVKRVGKVAYMLLLPESSQVHLVFHVSLLNKKAINFVVSPLVPCVELVPKSVVKEHELILVRRMV